MESGHTTLACRDGGKGTYIDLAQCWRSEPARFDLTQVNASNHDTDAKHVHKDACGSAGVVSLVLAKVVQDYKQLTGKSLSLDYDQEQALLAKAGADKRGIGTSKYAQLPFPLSQVRPVFTDGFMRCTLSEGVEKDLALAESFYELLDTQLPAAPTN